MRLRRLAGLLVLGLALTLSGCGINAIPALEEQAEAAWAQVLNQYQRRADLIPNLVETVKAAAAHERETLEAVVNARAKATQTTLPADILTNPDAMKLFEQNQAQLSSALARLMVVVEQYPNLKANENFLRLQDDLAGTENRVATARRDYILSVQAYNTELKTIPGRWYASWFYPDAKEMAQFTVDDRTHEVPKVDFGTTSQ
jgi:LemA protein